MADGVAKVTAHDGEDGTVPPRQGIYPLLLSTRGSGARRLTTKSTSCFRVRRAIPSALLHWLDLVRCAICDPCLTRGDGLEALRLGSRSSQTLDRCAPHFEKRTGAGGTMDRRINDSRVKSEIAEPASPNTVLVTGWGFGESTQLPQAPSHPSIHPCRAMHSHVRCR